jgi:hypothetical protein
VLAAALVSSGVHASYQAQSTFIADVSLTAKYKGLPIPDDVVRDVGTAQVRSAIAASLGISAADVGNLRFSAFGNPPNRLLVSFTSPDRARSLAVVRAADAAVLDYVASRTLVDRSNYQQAMDDAASAVATLQASLASGRLDDWQRADIEFKVWQAQQGRVLAKDSVDILSTVYEPQGDPTVSTASKTSALLSRVAAGALAGLFVGLLLAGAREALRRRQGAVSS